MAYSSVLLIASVLVTFFSFQVAPLNVGFNTSNKCSTTCESMFCDVPSPVLRYGKYCGFKYGGCWGQKPCDNLDACCMRHDRCIGQKGDDYLNVECNEELQRCVQAYSRSGAPSFKGNSCDVHKVVAAINKAMEVAIAAGKLRGHVKNTSSKLIN